MKITVGEPIVIVRGMTPEENPWGKYQFPRPFAVGDKIVVSVHVDEDDVYNMGSPCRWFETADKGVTWTEFSADLAPACGILLPNGDRYYLPIESGTKMDGYEQISVRYRTPDYDMTKPADEGKLPIWEGFTSFMSGDIVYCYLAEKMPPLLRDSVWKVQRTLPSGEVAEEKARVNWRSLSRVIVHRGKDDKFGTLKPINPRGNLKIGDDGALWVTAFSGEGHVNPDNGQYSPYYSAEIFRSTDYGKTFEHRSHMEYPADGGEYPYSSGGFSDSDIGFMPDGSMVWFMRSAWMIATGREWDPMYFSRSTDHGVTWTKPVKFDDMGVLPRLCKLNCGTTLLCYARPGLKLRASLDDSGEKWSEPIIVMKGENRSHLANKKIDQPTWFEWEGACGNPELIAVSDNEALLVYGDFYYPDETGVKRKTILCRKITVEMDKEEL